MIPASKLNNTYAALNAVLVTARAMAYDGIAADTTASVLDVADYLPRLLADEEDRTEAFRQSLEDLVLVNAGFNFALERFDNAELAKW